MPRKQKPSAIPVATLSEDQHAELNRIEREAFVNYEGPFDELEKALGILRLGHHVGWKPLLLIHSKRTIAKYEEILDIKLREIFPPEGPSATRSVGYKVAKKLANFWKAVSGDVSIEDRRHFAKDAPKGT
jgi:hypothetical protein